MKKLIATIILSGFTLTSYADFICKDIGPIGNFPLIKTFYTCRLESEIKDFNSWLN